MKLYIKNIPYFSILLFLLIACSSNSAYKFKTFIFDGVPNPNEVKIIENVVILDSIQSLIDSTQISNQIIPVKIKGSKHAPFQERKCDECHIKTRMGKTKFEQPKLCYQCHTNFEKKYNVLHGPVSYGKCSQCHDPHASENINLLASEGDDLCLGCHALTDVKENALHLDLNEKNCIDCHNAHGGENQFILKDNACFQCHEDKIFDKKFIHGPVEAGKCLSCHSTHQSKDESLLKIKNNELCLNCHDNEDVYTKEYHKINDNSNCVLCHNPHSSDKPNLIKNNIKL